MKIEVNKNTRVLQADPGFDDSVLLSYKGNSVPHVLGDELKYVNYYASSWNISLSVDKIREDFDTHKQVAEYLNKVDKSMSLADIFNITEDTQRTNQKKKIGF